VAVAVHGWEVAIRLVECSDVGAGIHDGIPLRERGKY
jgi:hypothetical protein